MEYTRRNGGGVGYQHGSGQLKLPRRGIGGVLEAPVAAALCAVDVGVEEAVVEALEERIDDLAIGVGDGGVGDVGGGVPFEAAFAELHAGDLDGGADFVEEHEPVVLVLVACFGDEACEVEVWGVE